LPHALKRQSTLKKRRFLQQLDELTDGNARLSKNCRERPSGEISVIRDNDRFALLISKYHVTTSPDLADVRARLHEIIGVAKSIATETF